MRLLKVYYDMSSHQGGRSEIPVSKMLAMMLNYLGSQMTTRHLARQFGVTTDAFIKCTETIMKLLMDLADKIIKWPSKDKYPHIAAQFNRRRYR